MKALPTVASVERGRAADDGAAQSGWRRGAPLSWACLGALLLFVAGRCLVPMDETDLFYNLRLGEIILGTHAVPRTNLLSFTAPDFPDPNLAWIFQIVLALAYRAGGIAGTVLLKTAFVMATFAILFRVALRRGAHPAVAAAVLALAAWAAEPRFVERPHLVTFLGLATLLLALERLEAGKPLLLWLMVPLGLVWANGNSCFFLAPAVLALYAAGSWLDARASHAHLGPDHRGDPRDRGPLGHARAAGATALLLLPVFFATPSGSGWIGYVANHFRMPWLRPLQEYRAAEWPTDAPFLFLLLAVTLVTVTRARPAAPDRPTTVARHLLPILALALLGSRRIRFVAEFALLAGPHVAAGGSALLGRWLVNRGSAARAAAGSFVVVTALVLATLSPRLQAARAGEPVLDLGIEAGLVPDAAIAWLDRHRLRDHLYNDLEVGSYLSWRGSGPEGPAGDRVFQDPRINAYPEELHAILRRPDLDRSTWEALMERFEIQSALITFPDLNPRAALFPPSRWALCYQGGDGLVFVRRTAPHAALIAEAELPLTFRFDQQAGVSPVPLLQRPPTSPVKECEWARRLGDVAFARSDWTSAAAAYRTALTSGADCLPEEAHQQALERAAMLALRFGEPERAAALLDGLTSPAARTNRGFALVQSARPTEALREFEAVLADHPGEAQASFGRGVALSRLGRTVDAEEALREFVARWPNHFATPQARALRTRLAGPR